MNENGVSPDTENDASPARVRDQVLSKQPRIRRGSELPSVFQREQDEATKYPHQLTLRDRRENFVARYRRTRWEPVFDFEGVVELRRTVCWVCRGKTRVGALRFQEIKVAPLITDQDFFNAMDAESAAASELAETLCVEWEDLICEVMEYGPVLEFQTAWMAPEYSRGSYWASLAECLIEKLFEDHSILVLKAFPLEYEGRCPEGSPAHSGMTSRQRAMVRHYRGLFGVRLLDGPPGVDGWMWRPNESLADVITDPCFRPELAW